MRYALLIAAVFALSGCHEQTARVNAPPHGQPENVNDMQGTFVYMTDNALLSNMTVSDMHFLPHRALLSPVGEERVRRLASLMDAYGGTIRLNSDEEDTALVDARLKAVKDYLTELGVDTTKEVVQADLPGGRGMDANQAIMIRAAQGGFTPAKKSGASQSSSGASNGSNSDKPATP